jgi:hypothetical protein
MQCNPNSHASITDPIQQILNEANAQVKRHRADIRDTLKLINLKISSLPLSRSKLLSSRPKI